MSCFNDISDSMEESAVMNGANHLTIFARIYVPMSIPVIVTILMFSGVFHWGSWFDSIYYVKRQALQTLAAYMLRVLQRAGTDVILGDRGGYETFIKENEVVMINSTGLRYSIIIVGILPVLMVYPFIQKYFVKGIRLGAIKGRSDLSRPELCFATVEFI